MANSPSRTNLFGLRARNAATISGKAEVRLLPVLDCKKMFSSSRKTRQRNPSHFGSYIHSLPMGKFFTARAFIGVIGGLRNLSIERLGVTTRNGILLIIWCNEHPPLPTTSFSSFAQFLLSESISPKSTPQEGLDSDGVGYGFEPTVGLQAQEYRLRHKRASFLVSRRLGKAPSIYILDRVPRSCASGLFPWAASLCSAHAKKICHSIFFSPQANFKIFQKLLPKRRRASRFANGSRFTVHHRYLALNTFD
jgi:hypothetical protein